MIIKLQFHIFNISFVGEGRFGVYPKTNNSQGLHSLPLFPNSMQNGIKPGPQKPTNSATTAGLRPPLKYRTPSIIYTHVLREQNLL